MVVLFSSVNGSIKVGDRVAISPFDGVEMKSSLGYLREHRIDRPQPVGKIRHISCSLAGFMDGEPYRGHCIASDIPITALVVG